MEKLTQRYEKGSETERAQIFPPENRPREKRTRFHTEGKNPQIPSIMSQPVVDLSQFNISKEEKDKLVAEVIRYVLFKTHHSSGCPIKREELTQLLTKNYRLRNLPTIIINEAIQKLSAIFGYEMQELQRSRPSSANQGRLSQQSAVEAKSYIITTDLWRNLRRMGLDESNENHPVLGNIKQALDTLVQQRYLQKDKVSGPEGNTLFYELGERALDAPFSESTKAHISEIVNKEIVSVDVDD